MHSGCQSNDSGYNVFRMRTEDFFPRIQKDGKVCYGGCQEWYEQQWARWAGCASVAGANEAAFYDARFGGLKPEFSYAQFLARMKEMYHYMAPGVHGFPNPYRFVERFEQYEADHGHVCQGKVYSDWSDWRQAYAFVCQTLQDLDLPVMLVLRHTAPAIQEDTWHWMSLPAVQEEERTFSVSSYAEKETYQAEEIFAPLKGNQVYLLSFAFTE